MDREIAYGAIGARLETKLNETGLSRDEQAESLGISRSALATYISLERIPSASTVARAVDRFDIDPRWLLTGDDRDRITRDQWVAVLSAFVELKAIMDRLFKDGIGWHQASHDDRMKVYRAGETLYEIGGISALNACANALYEGNPGAQLGAGDMLNHLFNGIGPWRA
ncbi:MAG: helix-turn-helix transcriptional regulator [Paracoccus denitrificans]|uniref:Helix-turn-helix transcriptional regulator n=1 Tax=Paracoccus denitrificans TaxID=266 RepID=A0A533I404_PARDE|nr:MAG: helix-turn-helix transcriptional regulator [Paracoccus denitrificans]